MPETPNITIITFILQWWR